MGNTLENYSNGKVDFPPKNQYCDNSKTIFNPTWFKLFYVT